MLSPRLTRNNNRESLSISGINGLGEGPKVNVLAGDCELRRSHSCTQRSLEAVWPHVTTVSLRKQQRPALVPSVYFKLHVTAPLAVLKSMPPTVLFDMTQAAVALPLPDHTTCSSTPPSTVMLQHTAAASTSKRDTPPCTQDVTKSY